MLPCEDPIDAPRDNLPGFFASADRFCTWLGVCPCNRISGGRILGSATRKTSNRLAEALRLAAFGLERANAGWANTAGG